MFTNVNIVGMVFTGVAIVSVVASLNIVMIVVISSIVVVVVLCIHPAGDFLKPDQLIYDDIVNLQELKKFLEGKLEDYNKEPGTIAIDLVLFKDAIEHGTVPANTRARMHTHTHICMHIRIHNTHNTHTLLPISNPLTPTHSCLYTHTH